MSNELPTYDVATVDAMPPIDGRTFDVARFTDYLLTRLLGHAAGVLHSDFHSDEGRWRLLHWSDGDQNVEESLVVTPNRGRFRAVLAHLGVRFLSGEIYGGFAEGYLAHRSTARYFALYTANDSLRGYWVRLYARSA